MTDEITVREAAERLGYTPESVRQLLRKSKLPGWKAGGLVWLIPADAVDRYREAVRGKSKNDPTRGR